MANVELSRMLFDQVVLCSLSFYKFNFLLLAFRHGGRKAAYNIGFYASWAGRYNISYLQIPASVPA